MSRRFPIVLPIVLVLACLAAACGDDGSTPAGDGGAGRDGVADASKPTNTLTGSISSSLDLTFHKVEIFRQYLGGTLISVTVQYIHQPTAADPTLIAAQVKANAPITVGQPIDLLFGGKLARIMGDGSAFPKLQQGSVTFTETGEGGGNVSGSFAVTFEGGATLAGSFTGKAQTTGS